MQSKGNRPSASQVRWREDVRELGSIVSGERPCVIHHCVGATGKHDKVAIGNWFLLPLTDTEHAEIHASGKSRKLAEARYFEKLIRLYVRVYKRPIPLPVEVVDSIRSYHR